VTIKVPLCHYFGIIYFPDRFWICPSPFDMCYFSQRCSG